jgi:tetratricopeptide (TPR) repeat protein
MLLCMLGLAEGARAEPSVAERLFREGRDLLLIEQYEAASKKFAESQALDPSSGTLLNLAHCHEQLGRYASAWDEFMQAARLASAQGAFEREAEARRRASLLASRLSFLVVKVEKPVPELTIERNGTVIEAANWNALQPVDAGSHVIRANAPDRIEWVLRLVIQQPGEHVVEVPELAQKPAMGFEPLGPDGVSLRPQPQRIDDRELGSAGIDRGRHFTLPFWLAGSASVLATGFATATGIMSLNNYSEAKQLCPSREECNPDAMAARKRAGDQATITNIAVATAIGTAGLAAFFYFTSGEAASSNNASARRAPSFSSSPFAWSW